MNKFKEFYLQRKRMINLLLASCVSFILIIIFMNGFSSNSTNKNSLRFHKEDSGTSINSYEDIFDSKEASLLSMQSKMKLNENDLKQLEDKFNEMQKYVNESTKNLNVNQENENLELKRKISALEEKLHLKDIIDTKQANNNFNDNILNKPEDNKEKVFRKEIRLTPRASDTGDILTTEDTIPAGSFAKAVVLHGINAPASINAAAEPLPLLLRITDYAHLPKRIRSNVEDCHIIAEGYAVLSSESIAVRLNKMSCIEKDSKKIIETEITGYLTGENGREGLNGEVVHKDNMFVINSFLSGMFSGLGELAKPQLDVIPFGSGAVTAKAPGVQKKATMAGAQGLDNAMERLSKYYIERAEQIQPVISIESGRVVDVVFTTSAKFGAKDIKKSINRNQSDTNYSDIKKYNFNDLKINQNFED